MVSNSVEYFTLALEQKKFDRVMDQAINEYMTYFIGLYTGNVLDNGSALMEIKETEVTIDSGAATLTQYFDGTGKCLRYKIDMFGETMSAIINYYLCNDFVLVSRQCNYYSSWLQETDKLDVLYSEIEKWLIYDDEIYVIHDDGELEYVREDQIPFPRLDEITGLVD